jgi:hypothetical protein
MTTPKVASPVRKKKKAAFLAALAELGLVRDAARRVGIGKTTAYDWRRASPSFSEAMDKARQQGEEHLADELEHALVKRGRDGFEKPVWYKGQKVGAERWFSDTACIFLLKGLRPHKYMEQLVGVQVGGQAVVVKIQSFSASPPPSLPSAPPALSEGDVVPTEATR